MLPIVCSTQLPGTEFSICLHGPRPDSSEYVYSIETSQGDCGIRELGNVTIDETIPPRLDDLGSGVFRVTWGTSPHTAFVTVDTRQLLIVEDSNKSSPAEVPFEEPRYLRNQRRD
jgi:hypothetical protein